MLAVCKGRGSFSDRTENPQTPPRCFWRGCDSATLWPQHRWDSTHAGYQDLCSPERVEKQQEDRSSGDRGLWHPTRMRASGLFTSRCWRNNYRPEAQMRHGTSYPTRWSAPRWPERSLALLFCLHDLWSRTRLANRSLPHTGVLSEQGQRRKSGWTIAFLEHGVAAPMPQEEETALPETLACVCKLLGWPEGSFGFFLMGWKTWMKFLANRILNFSVCSFLF